MRITKSIIAILIALFFSISFLSAEDYPGPDSNDGNVHGSIYLGGFTLPMQVSGLVDVDISDYYQPGITSANEGRVAVPLSEYNTGVESALGLVAGVEYDVLPIFGVVIEGQALIGSTMFLTSTLIGVHAFIPMGPIKIGAMVKFGGIWGNMYFGDAEIKTGYNAPVITEEGDIFDGDEITAEVKGGIVQLVLTASVNISQGIGVFAQVGYSGAFLGDITISVKPEGDSNAPESTNPEAQDVESSESSTTIDFASDSQSVVLSDTTTVANLQPEITSSGYFIMLGINYAM